MKNILHQSGRCHIALILMIGLYQTTNAQTFPTPGITLPPGKTLVITYEVDVNANVCPNGTVPMDISNQSNVTGTNFPTVLTNDPANPAPDPSPTLTPVAGLSLGDLVYLDINNNGVFDAGDAGINGVSLNIYADDGDGVLDAGDGPALATTTTAGGGLYLFTPVCPGNYIVEIAPSNFNPGGPLYDNGLMAALISSPVGGAPDPDNDVNNDDNGDAVPGFGVASAAITLALGTEPITDGDADNNTNLTLDFGFKVPTTVTINDVTTVEGTGAGTTAFVFTVTRSSNAEAFSLTVNTADGSATTLDNDYVAIAGGTVSFTAGGALTQSVTVNVNQDAKVEPNETFTVTLSAPPPGVIITDASGTGTITNDDSAVVTLSGTTSQNEGTSFIFTATLNNPVAGGFSVAYTTNNGTATIADNDYTDNDGTLVFAGTAGETQNITVNTTNDSKVELDETFTVALGVVTGGLGGVTTTGSPQTGTITNNDQATVAISNVSQDEGNAGNTPFTFTVTLTGEVDVAVSLNYASVDGTATIADVDYVANAGSVIFTANGGAMQSGMITIQVVGDMDFENDETFLVSLSNLLASGRNVVFNPAGPTLDGTGTIVNDDIPPVLINELDADQVGTDASEFIELYDGGTGNTLLDGMVLVFFNGSNDQSYFALDLDGFSTNASGYFIAGNASVTGVDAIFAGNLLQNGEDAVALYSGNAADFPNGTVVTTVNLLDAVVYDTGDPDDPGLLTLLNPGQPQVNEDGAGNGTCHSIQRISNGSGGPRNTNTYLALPPTPDAANFISLVSVTFSPTSTPEDGADMLLIFARTGPSTCDLSVTYTLGGTASPSDYSGLPSNPIIIPAGSGSVILNINPAADLSVEPDETIIVTLSDGPDYNLGVPVSTTGTITNDDAATLTLSGTTTQAEGTTFTFTATLSAPVDGGFTVPYTTNSGSATTADNDYTDNDGILSFTGTAGETQMITVLTTDDMKVELDETFTVALGAIAGPAGITVNGSPQTGTISNNDAAIISVASDVSQDESAGAQLFTITLSNPVDAPVSVSFTTVDGTASFIDNDYTLILNQIVTFPAGTTTSQVMNVGITDDNKVEDNEIYSVNISSLMAGGRNVSLGNIARTGTILNDDQATLTLFGPASTNEGHELTTPVIYYFTLSAEVQGGFAIFYSANDGTATTADNDYIDNDGAITFAGTAGEQQTITIDINGDYFVEPDEHYSVNVGGFSGLSIEQEASISVLGSPVITTIVNDEIDGGDAPETYQTYYFPSGPYHPAVFGYSLGAAIDGELTGNPTPLADGDDTDAEGDDEDGVTIPNPLISNTINNIVVNASQPGFLLTFIDFNGNGTFLDPGDLVFNNLPLNAGDNFLSILVPLIPMPLNTFARFRYSQNPMAPLPGGFAPSPGEVEDYAVYIVNTQFSIDDPTVVEGNAGTTNLTFTVTRSNNFTANSVNYAITGGTATTGDNDYQPLAAGTLNFPASGALSQTISVAVNGDVKVELDETVIMNLSAPVNASILDGSGTGTIINDDAAVITINNVSLAEGCTGDLTNVIFTVSMSNPADIGINMIVGTFDGTATIANNDYVSFAAILPIFAGAQMQTFGVPIVGDCFIEPDETFIARLSALSTSGRNITFSGGGPTLDGTGTITNDDAVPVITCPGPITVSCATEVPAPNPALVTSMDNCGDPASISFVQDVVTPGSCVNRFTITRTYMATDGCGNTSTCNQTITVNDVTPPTLTCPGPVTVQCAALVPAPNISLVTSTDNCNGAPVITFVNDVISNQTCINRFTVTRTYRATDVCGNSATCTQLITVLDNTAPTLTCPGPVTVQCASQVPLPNTTLVITSDNCAGTPTVTHVGDVISNMTCPNRFTVTRTYRSTDACGNSATCAQTITVFDNTPPTITCPAPITVQCAALVPAPAPASVVTSDNCGGGATVTFINDVISNQTCINRFIVTRTYRATDACGNTSQCTQVITVFDNTNPVITFNHPVLTGVPNGGTAQVQCFGQDPLWEPPTFNESSVSVADNCAGNITVNLVDVLIDEGDCSGDGYINRHRLTWTATDACGNSSTAFVFVELVDTIPPAFTNVPANVTVNCNGIPEVPSDVFALDECLCMCDLTFIQDGPDPGCQQGQIVTRTWTAVDNCGNIGIAVQYITLQDSEGPPMVINHPMLAGTPNGAVIEYTCEEFGIPGFYEQLDADDVTPGIVCGDLPVVSFNVKVHTPRNCEFFGYKEQRVFTWTSTDLCGNTAVFSITARVVDTEAPLLINVPDFACIGSDILKEVDILDNCDNASFWFWDTEIDNPCGNGLAYRRTYEGRDACGNYTRDTVILVEDDHIPPVIEIVDPTLAALTPGEVLEADCAGVDKFFTLFGIESVLAKDDCEHGLTVTFEERSVAGLNCATTGVAAELELVWTATDICGNASQVIIPVQIIDLTPPEIVDFKTSLAVDCNDTIPDPVVTDNCGNVSLQVIDVTIPGTCEYEYSVHRTIQATDPCGNSVTKEQLIFVGDNSGPDFQGLEPVICDNVNVPEVAAFDPCAGQYVPISYMEEEIVDLCREGKVIRRTWSATDACGHVSTASQLIIIGDSIPPKIFYSTSSIIRLMVNNPYNLVKLSKKSVMQKLNALNEYSIFIEDECGIPVIPEFSLTISYSDDCIADGYYERRVYTWVVSDLCGNTSVLTFSVDIMDDIDPVFLNLPSDTSVICDDLPPVAVVQTQDFAQIVDVIYQETIVPGINPGEFNVTRTWVATDPCGNSTTGIQHIFWIPNTNVECQILLPGIVDCNTHDVAINSFVFAGVGPFTYKWEVTGEGLIQDGQGTPTLSIYVGFSEVEITLTVTDAYGCTSVCTGTLDCDFTFEGFISNDQINGQSIEEHHISRDEDIPVIHSQLQHARVWPNPADQHIKVEYTLADASNVEISFINVLGQSTMENKMEGVAGINQHEIDVNSIPSGYYVIRIKADEEVLEKTILIVR